MDGALVFLLGFGALLAFMFGFTVRAMAVPGPQGVSGWQAKSRCCEAVQRGLANYRADLDKAVMEGDRAGALMATLDIETAEEILEEINKVEI